MTFSIGFIKIKATLFIKVSQIREKSPLFEQFFCILKIDVIRNVVLCFQRSREKGYSADLEIPLSFAARFKASFLSSPISI